MKKSLADKFLPRYILNEETEVLDEITAYHGSPYDFQEFDVEHIGSGEGAIVHGWGLYFALKQKIVYDRYRSRINNDKKNSFSSYKLNGKVYEKGTVWYKIIDLIKNGSKDDAVGYLNNLINNEKFTSKNPDYNKRIREIIDDIDKIEEKDISDLKKVAGQIYTVELPELQYFLDEDKIFEEQSDFVKEKLLKLQEDNPKMGLKLDGYIGEQIYNYITASFEDKDNYDDWDSKKKASLLLNSYGIVGIKYDGNTDEDCVVIFNKKDIKIINKKYDSSSNDEVYIPDEEKLEEDPEYIKDIENPSEELQLIAINKDPEVIQLIKNPTEKVKLEAVRLSHEVIKYIENPSEEVQMAAVKDDFNAIRFIKNPSEKMIQEIIKISCDRLKYNNVSIDNEYVFASATVDELDYIIHKDDAQFVENVLKGETFDIVSNWDFESDIRNGYNNEDINNILSDYNITLKNLIDYYEYENNETKLPDNVISDLSNMLFDNFYDGMGVNSVLNDCLRNGAEIDMEEDVIKQVKDIQGIIDIDIRNDHPIKMKIPREIFLKSFSTDDYDDSIYWTPLACYNDIEYNENYDKISIREPQYGWDGFDYTLWEEACKAFGKNVNEYMKKVIEIKNNQQIKKESKSFNKFVNNYLPKYILNEGKEEMKKYFPLIPDEKIDKTLELDPTYKGGEQLGKYSKWILRLVNNFYKNAKSKKSYDDFIKKYPNGINPKNGQKINPPTKLPEVQAEDEHKIKSLLIFYDKNSKYINRKIDTIKDVNELYKVVDDFKKSGITEKIANDKKEELIKKSIELGLKIVFDDEKWLVGIFTTHDSSHVFSQETNWCTTSGDAKYYNDYSSKGPLYFNYHKPTGDLYQFHFETNQYMDKGDNPVNILNLLNSDEKYKKFYLDILKKEYTMDELCKNCNYKLEKEDEKYVYVRAKADEVEKIIYTSRRNRNNIPVEMVEAILEDKSIDIGNNEIDCNIATNSSSHTYYMDKAFEKYGFTIKDLLDDYHDNSNLSNKVRYHLVNMLYHNFFNGKGVNDILNECVRKGIKTEIVNDIISKLKELGISEVYIGDEYPLGIKLPKEYMYLFGYNNGYGSPLSAYDNIEYNSTVDDRIALTGSYSDLDGFDEELWEKACNTFIKSVDEYFEELNKKPESSLENKNQVKSESKKYNKQIKSIFERYFNKK